MDITISSSIAAFAPAIAPPPPVVVNLDCTDLFIPLQCSVLDIEDLDPAQKPSDVVRARSSTPTVRFHPYIDTHQNLKETGASSSKRTTVRSKGKARAISTPLSSAPTSPEPSPSPEPPRRESSTLNRDATPSTSRIQILIPRPKNASRQNLEKLLDWKSDEYKHFRAAVTIHCKTTLNPTKCYVAQDPKKLKIFRTELLQDFPRLSNYEYAWPLEIAAQATLKSSSAAAKRPVKP